MMKDIDWLRICYEAAAKSSTDPSTQNGAVLVTADGTFIVEANRFPNKVEETPERWTRPLKYSFVEHAERNAIYRAAREGLKTAGATLYCPWFACADCARAIIEARIVEVVGHLDEKDEETNARWAETCKIGDQMLYEAGVRFRRIPGKIGGIFVRRNGILVEV
jgi:dCMP deaminase